jgi:ribosomal protein S18 acetylase RimI-like enzyme
MTQSEFEAYLQSAIREYADEKVRAGNWQPAEAMQRSEQEYAKLLPDGLETKNEHLYSIVDDARARPVGMIWFERKEGSARPLAFLYDFIIYEEFRRKGYGRRALAALEAKVKEMGLDKISLHVFGHNKAAFELYSKLGYKVTNILMSKEVA